MPNWVTSKVSIKGDKKEIEKLMKNISGTDTIFDFEKIVPTPKTLNIISGSITEDALYVYISLYKQFLSRDRIEKVLQAFREENEFRVVPSADSLSPDKAVFTESFLALKASQSKGMYSSTASSKADCEKETESIEYLFDTNKGYPRNVKDYLAYGKIVFENLEKYRYSTWYEWKSKNWGTKWNTECTANRIYEENEEATVEYVFDTAWRTPLQIFVRLVANYDVKITVDYAGEDGYSCGTVSITREGCVVKKRDGDEKFASSVLNCRLEG